MLDLTRPFTVRLTMHSDWHVGSGTGRPGNVDRLVQRDADGLPFVPAKTLKGIWRDACERLAWGLDGGVLGRAAEWVDFLFGDQPALRGKNPGPAPLPAAIVVRPARMPNVLCRHFRGDSPQARLLRAATTFVKPGVRIDSSSGSAMQDHLRMEEMARPGAMLQSECEWYIADVQFAAGPDGDRQRQCAAALLVAASRLVERLGGKRRRGAGNCSMELALEPAGPAVDWHKAVEWLEQHAELPDVPRRQPKHVSATAAPPPAASGWVSLPIVLELLSPLAVTRQTVGNVAETHDFLPGTLLVPHIARRLRERFDFDASTALRRGDLCVLPATIELNEGGAVVGRADPVPFCLFEKKSGSGWKEPNELVNRLVEKQGEQQLKQCRRGYVCQSMDTASKKLRHASVPLTVLTHNTVEDDVQRPTTDVGGVYSYEAIAHHDHDRPVRLTGEIRMRRELADQMEQRATGKGKPNWWSELSGETRLGRSSKDDYGRVRLTVAQPRNCTASPASRTDNLLFVRLVSDVLLRGATLRYEPTVKRLREELEGQFKRAGHTCTICCRDQTRGPDDPLPFTVRARRIDSWHTRWGLPRPALAGLQAGSCVVFRVDPYPLAGVLAQIEAAGIGERTAEGYGQVRFNDPLVAEAMSGWSELPSPDSPSDDSPKPLQPNDAGYEFACSVERAAWRTQIRRAIAAAMPNRAAILGWQFDPEAGKSRPPLSQIGALRTVLGVLGDDTVPRTGTEGAERRRVARERILAWLDKLKGAQKRAEKWTSVKSADGSNALHVVRRLIEKEEVVWAILRKALAAQHGTPNTEPATLPATPADDSNDKQTDRGWPTITDRARERLETELWSTAVLGLIAAAHKAQQRGEQRQTKAEVVHGS